MPKEGQKSKNQQQIRILERSLKKDKLKKNEYVRIQAVLLNLKGYTHKEISQINLKSIEAIEKWITLFNKQGVPGLRDKTDKQPSSFKLSRPQKNQIKKIIIKNNPGQLGLQGEFWNPGNLKQLIRDRFKIIYQSNDSYRRILKYCGFSYQKVQFKDSRESKQYKRHEKLRLEKKLKKGVLRMYW